jgi:hypothetical protein
MSKTFAIFVIAAMICAVIYSVSVDGNSLPAAGIFHASNAGEEIYQSSAPIELQEDSTTGSANAEDESGAAIKSDDNKGGRDTFRDHVLPLLNKYCFDCHAGSVAEAEVDFAPFKSQEDVLAGPETFQKALKAISEKHMPPDDSDQPSADERITMASGIRTILGSEADEPFPAATIRRLTRFEYENTIRDLLRMSRDVFTNPNAIVWSDQYFDPASGKMADQVFALSMYSGYHYRSFDLNGVPSAPLDRPAEHGFNNESSVVSLSPLLIEKYFRLAESILNSNTTPRLCGIWEPMFLADATLDADQINQLASTRLGPFIDRAFRRMATNEEKQVYFQLFQHEFAKSANYTEAMKTTVAAILVSPQFLIRFDSAQGDSDVAMNDNFKIASRLSYFLWCSMPDDILFQAAREERLTNPDEIRRQVKRMLRDRRVKAFASDFANQWLKLQSVTSSMPDPEKFEAFYGRKTSHYAISMMIEQLLLFETILVEDRSIMEFVHADYAYWNYDLMRFYGHDPAVLLGFAPDKSLVEDFYRIKIDHRMRGGVITSGATLLLTSTPNRTSPVNRGVWILTAILNNPPPPPPAAVPPLKEPAHGEVDSMTIRERTAQHRENPACAVCHDRIDPVGFALEHFDTIGRFRKVYENGEPVDASGQFNDQPFTSAAQFKIILMSYPELFTRAFTKHVLRYSLGRKLHHSDEIHIDQMVKSIKEHEMRFSSVIEAIAVSEVFRGINPSAISPVSQQP